MADKSVGELIAAQSVTPTDLFVLEQNGTAKKLTGQILENWLVSFADGHGGIQSIEKLPTSGLADTYRITLADTTTFDFVVTNGRGVTGISKTGTSGLVDAYTISYNDGTTSNFTVTNGEKGDKGDNAYVWIKYASQEPTESSHSMGDIPDDWIGIYSGNSSTAPTDWQQYQWFKHKGEKGDTGNPATLVTKSVTYQVSDSGTITPSGAWGSSIPVVSQGKYLWTKTEVRFNTGDPIVSYSVARMGIDGTGSVSSVAGVSPDATGNVPLTAADVGARQDTWMPTASDVGALPTDGGKMTGPINMNGQPISGLNDPTEDTQAATKGYVDGRTAADIGAFPVLDGAGAHNAIYRGKNIQSKYDDGSLWTAISSGTFEDLYIGDYFDITISTSFTASETVRCLLAGFDVYYKCGDSQLNTHHAVVVPMNCFAATAAMNSSNVTTGAYYGSAMHQTVLPKYSAAIKNVLGNHLLTHRSLISNAVSNGVSSGWAYYNLELRLMSEPEVYGTTVHSTYRDIGDAKTQLPIFIIRPDKIICGLGGADYASDTNRYDWWLSTVSGSNEFARLYKGGAADKDEASKLYGVRPRFLIS